MAALTKEKPITVDMNIYSKQANACKNGKNIHYTKQYKCPEPLLQRHRNPDINYNKKQFKEEKQHNNDERSVPNEENGEENGEKDKQVPIKKYDKKINTSYTPLTLIVHVLIILQHIYTLYTTPTSSMPWRLASFTQLVYVTTTCFHIATLLASLFKKIKLERAFVLYGTWVIWIGWAMCLWLIRPEDRPELYRALTTNGGSVGIDHYYVNLNSSYDIDELLAPMDVSPFLMNGKWSTTTLPIISFFLLLVIRRNHWGLITWEYLVLLEYSRTLKWYRTWCVAGAGAGWMLTWEASKFWLRIPFSEGGMVLYRTDLPSFPGVFNVLWASSIAGILMVCWWSFWTFQYRGIVWKKEFKEGVVVWSSSDGLICVGAIGC